MLRMIQKLRFVAVVSLTSLFSLTACAQTQAETSQNSSTYYNDCSNLAFKNTDNSQLTKQEELAALEQDFFEVLNQNEACMTQAVAASNGRVGSAGSGQGAEGSGKSSEGSQAVNNVQSSPTANQQVSHSTQQHQISGRTGKGLKSGSTSICATVKEALANATTESETEHFESMMKQYNCN